MSELVPKLRFEVFSESWQIKTLTELGQFQNGLNKDSQDFGFGYPFINLMDVFGKNKINTSNLGLVNASEKDLKTYNLLEGDVLFIRSSVKRSGVGQTVVCDKPLNNTVYSGFLIRFRTHNLSLTNEFKRYCFKTSKFRNNLLRLSTSSANTNINQESLKKLSLLIPEPQEQQKIADFLNSVDTKISQLTEKHRLLQEYKKGVMQQIFNQQIRFKDENGDEFPEWEEKTIGDIMTESRIKGNGGDTAKKLTVKIWGKGVIAKKEDGKGSENTQYYKRKAGQFIYGKLDFLNCAFAIIPNELDGFESTLDLPALDVTPLVNKYFALEVIKQKWFYKKYGDIADGSRKAKRINVNVFQEMPIRLPVKDEQDKIMLFLQAIDQKIAAVAEQIEQSKQFKKGLLQQMFV